jgi:hypothetical protein
LGCLPPPFFFFFFFLSATPFIIRRRLWHPSRINYSYPGPLGLL